MNNPVLSNNRAFTTQQPQVLDVTALENQYAMPDTTSTKDVMTYDNVLARSALLLGFVVVAGVVGWMMPAVMLPALFAGIILGLVNAFKKKPNPLLMVGYAVAQGLALGALSGILEARLPGVVGQAVLATFVTAGVVLALFASGRVRTSPKLNKIFFVAVISYGVFSLVNLMLQLTGLINSPWGVHSITVFGIPLGAIIGVVAILLAAYSLVQDFELIKTGVQTRQPKQLAWTAAFGLTVTLVWLYMEFLRIFSILRDN